MKQRIKKMLTTLMVALLLITLLTTTAFASNTTTIGTGDVTATVPIEGSISALNISVTHAATISYAIDPNSGLTNEIIAPDIVMVNSTLAPINVSVESMTSAPGGTIQFTDVDESAKIWSNLNIADSKTYIALGIKIPDNPYEWGVGYNENTHFAIKPDSTFFGTLDRNSMGIFTLVGNHGLAFDQAYTAKHTLIFMFSLA